MLSVSFLILFKNILLFLNAFGTKLIGQFVFVLLLLFGLQQYMVHLVHLAVSRLLKFIKQQHDWNG